MNREHVEAAASFLIERRSGNIQGDRLPVELRPLTMEDALAIQKQVMQEIGDQVGGWKCVLPAGENLNIAPIFSATIYKTSPCPIRLDQGVCRIEPELAFRFGQDLPVRDSDYSEAEIMAALAGAHLVLELIENRYKGSEEISYLEHLSDNLYNQGLYLGPEISLDAAIKSKQLDFVLTQGELTSFQGQHPNQGPILPVLWMVNFLRQSGIGIRAGQVVTTGSFAGVLDLKPNIPFTLDYSGLDTMSLVLQA